MPSIIEFQNASKQYHKKEFFFAKKDLFWALKDLSFSVASGETVGLVGPNGAGKTTVAKLIAQIVYPNQGAVSVRGKVVPIISSRGCLDGLLNGRENLSLLLSVFGLNHAEKKAISSQVVAFSGLEEFMDMPLRKYSYGMWSRLSFAIAIHVPFDVLVIDEVLAAGDIEFRRISFDKIKQLKREGKTIIFTSHNIDEMKQVADRIIWLENGRLKMDGPSEEILAAYTESRNQK
jgi:ABC-type polysaccharide/polyol phosphate transport system ATPase subunit